MLPALPRSLTRPLASSHRSSGHALGLAAVSALTLLLAACGEGEDAAANLPAVPGSTAQAAEAATATSEPSISQEEADAAWAEYESCMAEYGVDVSGLEDGAVFSEEEAEAMAEAEAECDPILDEAFGEFELSPEEEAELRDLELAFAECMRENGVEDYPDPVPGADPFEEEVEIEANVSEDVLGEAFEVCVSVYEDPEPDPEVTS